MAGKGSAPRKGANQNAYEINWEKIFGKHKPSHDAMEFIRTSTKEDTDGKSKDKDKDSK